MMLHALHKVECTLQAFQDLGPDASEALGK